MHKDNTRRGEKQQDSSSYISRRDSREYGAPPRIKRNIFDPLRQKAYLEAAAEAKREGLGNKLAQSPEITQKYEASEHVRQHEELSQSLVEAQSKRGKLERQIARASGLKLLLKKCKEDPKLQQGKANFFRRRTLALLELGAKARRAKLEGDIRIQTKKINSILEKVAEAEKIALNSLTLQDGPLKSDMRERIPYSTESGLHYGSENFEMPRLSHLTLDHFIHQGEQNTTASIVRRLHQFTIYYTDLSKLHNTEKGHRALEALCLAKSQKLSFEIQDLRHHRSYLANKHREIFREAVMSTALPHNIGAHNTVQREIDANHDTSYDDAHSDISHVTDAVTSIPRNIDAVTSIPRNIDAVTSIPRNIDAVTSIPRNIDAVTSTNTYNTYKLQALKDRIKEIDGEIQSKFDKISNLEDEKLGSIQRHIRGIQLRYRSLERGPDYRLMSKLVRLEEQGLVRSRAKEQLPTSSHPEKPLPARPMTWGAAVTRPYRFIYPVRGPLPSGEPFSRNTAQTTVIHTWESELLASMVYKSAGLTTDHGQDYGIQASPTKTSSFITPYQREWPPRSNLPQRHTDSYIGNVGTNSRHINKLENTVPLEGQIDSPPPPLFDPTQIKDNNISHLAAALNNQRNYEPIPGGWRIYTPDHNGELNISWTYHYDHSFWRHEVSGQEELAIGPHEGALRRYQSNQEGGWDETNLKDDTFGSYLQAPPPEKELPALPLASEITRMVRKLGPEDICVGNVHNVREWTTPIAFKLDGGKIQLAENLEQLTEYFNSKGYKIKIAGQEIIEPEQIKQLSIDNGLVELEGTDNQKIELKLLELKEAEQDLRDRIRDNNISHLAADLAAAHQDTNDAGQSTARTPASNGKLSIRWDSADNQNWHHRKSASETLIFRSSTKVLEYYGDQGNTTDTDWLFESYLEAALQKEFLPLTSILT